MYNGKIRIALVEDSNCDLVLIKKVLENGFNEAEIHVFSTIESFKENWDSNETDIIISDHQIVDLTSFDLIKYLVDEGFTTPIIILSGALSDTD
ncbi:MAG: response regulator, partial [Balneolaceae bacterium]